MLIKVVERTFSPVCFFDVRHVVSSELLAEMPYEKAIIYRKIFDLPCYHF